MAYFGQLRTTLAARPSSSENNSSGALSLEPFRPVLMMRAMKIPAAKILFDAEDRKRILAEIDEIRRFASDAGPRTKLRNVFPPRWGPARGGQ